MKSILLQTLIAVRYSYWFIPSLMAVGAAVLAGGLVSLDVYYLTEIPEGYAWLLRSQPSGARALLSTVAGSTITVAGVVFSMTIMAVSHATSNYGSRLLLKFLKDRRNQISLGTFIATFIYCLLVLRTVSSAEDGAQYSDFVPHLAVLGALGMALASVGVLIAFIHHVPDTIHIGDVASDRGSELLGRMNDLFPPIEGDQEAQFTHRSEAPDGQSFTSIKADQSGYLQTLDVAGLLEYCSEHQLLAVVEKNLGDFTYQGETVLRAQHQSEDSGDLDDMLKFFVIGDQRTPAQDTRFLIEELSQIAIRALSPGINDPFTAITCIDWLGNAVAHVVNRPVRNPALSDEQDQLRLIMPCYDFSELLEQTFTLLRPYVAMDLCTSLHTAKIFNNILSCSKFSHRRELIVQQAERYLAESRRVHTNSVDQQRLQDAFDLAS